MNMANNTSSSVAYGYGVYGLPERRVSLAESLSLLYIVMIQRQLIFYFFNSIHLVTSRYIFAFATQ